MRTEQERGNRWSCSWGWRKSSLREEHVAEVGYGSGRSLHVTAQGKEAFKCTCVGWGHLPNGIGDSGLGNAQSSR